MTANSCNVTERPQEAQTGKQKKKNCYSEVGLALLARLLHRIPTEVDAGFPMLHLFLIIRFLLYFNDSFGFD